MKLGNGQVQRQENRVNRLERGSSESNWDILYDYILFYDCHAGHGSRGTKAHMEAKQID